MFFPVSLGVAALALASSVSATVYDITVGDKNGDTMFTPEAIFANPGDQVVFHFQQKNHSVTQSSFAAPCSLKDGGFDSGFHPVPANQTDNFPTYAITVNDTNPIWVFCDQASGLPTSHCGKGMVFAVNCGQDGTPNSFTNFKSSALAIGAQLQAQASGASATPPASSTPVATAAYGGVTIPPAPSESVVTVVVTVEASVWTSVYSSYPGSPQATPASLAGNVHQVVVGNSNGSLTFDPAFVAAQPRDTISFQFHQKNHTVTQSTFDAPCLAKTGGLDSGFQAVAANATDFPVWNVTVNDTAPLWFFCEQHKPDGSSHCGAGMVFAVNPVQDSARNFTAYQSLAQTLNGTNTTGGAAQPSPSPSPTASGASSTLATNLALGLGSIVAIVAAIL